MKFNIFHIEDYDEEKGVDYSKELKNEALKYGLAYVWADNLEEAKKKVDKNHFDVFVLDGQFPEEKFGKPDKENFFKIFSFIISKGIPKARIIAWSNSTTIHNYCVDNGITCFSKKDMEDKDYLKKGNNPDKKVKKKNAAQLIKEIKDLLD